MDASVTKLLEQQRALSEFGQFAFRSTDLQAVLHEAAVVCARSMAERYCKVCRFRREQNDLLIVAGVGWKPDVVGHAVSKVDMMSPGGSAYVTREPVVCTDLAGYDHLPPFYAQHSIVSTVNVVIPGTNGDTPFGILEIDSDQPREYEEQDITFLTGFANVLAEAVATNQRMQRLQAALAEKEVLSRELQHRVRNNLHLIYNMLSMEAVQHDPGRDPSERFADIANRVKALATVYDHLLGTGMTRNLALDEYLAKLCDTLREFQPGNVSLVQHAAAGLKVDLDTATALGIAITEIITNSYKHAFPSGSGTIEVSVEARQVPVIRVIDNGVGINPTITSNRHGLGLVRRLVEQVNGVISITRGDVGTQCEIVLPQAAG
jgi:two-component sensor histidine kinase/putative methionine-R-sulfoxide reductase with GAF domain